MRDRVAQNSAAVLSQALPLPPLCRVLDRTPGQVAGFLIFLRADRGRSNYTGLLLNDKKRIKSFRLQTRIPLNSIDDCHNLI